MSDDIVREFLVESSENLDLLDRELVQLEKNPTKKETLSSIFRTIHTIKGTCGFLGFIHKCNLLLSGRFVAVPLHAYQSLKASLGFVLNRMSMWNTSRALVPPFRYLRTDAAQIRSAISYARLTTIGVWSDGFSRVRGSLSMTHATNLSASLGEIRK